MDEQRDPHGENPTEAFLKTLGDDPQSDGGVPELPRIDPSAFATLPTTGTDTPNEPEKPVLEGSDAEAYEALKRRRAERRKKKLVRRGIVAGVVLAIAAVGVGIWWFTSQQTPEQGQMAPVTETVMRGTFTDAVDAKGTLEPNALTVVSTQIDGAIASVDVTEGQHVDAGAQLLTIKNDQLDAEVNEAARNVDAAKGALNAAAIRRDEAKKAASTPATATDPETGRTISTGGMMGSKADVADAQAAVNQAQGQLDSANAALAAAQAKASQRTVTAPAAGSIVNLNAKVGASLSDIAAGAAASGSASGAGLMQIADLSKMKVTVQVGEEDIAKVSVGQQANVTFPAFADIALTGTVTGIASVASSDSSGMSYGYDGSVSPTFAVDVLIDAPDGRLKPGMTAQVQLVTKQLDDVVMVPAMALLTDDGTSYYVNVLKDPETGETERRDVTVAAQNDDFAVIGKPKDAAADSNPDLATASVEDGDTLVISGGMSAGGDMGGASGESGAVSGGMAVM